MKLLLLIVLSALGLTASADNGHNIQVELTDHTGDTIYLGYYLGKGQYYQDTAVAGENGVFTFKNDEPLEPGVYLIVVPPANQYFQFVVNQEEQQISLKAAMADPMGTLEVTGSTDTELFYDYMNFLNSRRPIGDSLASVKKAAIAAGEDVDPIDRAIDNLDNQVLVYQQRLIKEHPDKLTTAIVRAGLEIKVPDMEGDEGEVQLKTYKYYKAHYFDNVDFANPGLLRSPLLFNRVESYLERLTPRHPDSIAIALTIVLDEMKPSYETFKYYLIHYLNEYAQSKIVGMDAVYVRLVDEYYRTGDADWTDPEQLKKILSNAQSIKPTLIGKTAPDIAFENRAGEQMNLHEMSADYTVLYIWQPDCGHCKKQTPKLIKFYEDYKESGVEVVAVCMKFTDEVPKCWEYIDSRPGMELFYNLVDPYNRSKYPTLYYVKSTPQLFVLDKDKKILTKRIGVEQLPEVMDALMKKSSDTD